MTYERLNRAFRMLLDGAELVTLARNRYWQANDGLMLDTGPFCAALEHASGKTAILAGKPSPAFFEAALASTGAAPSETAVVGDDLESDVGGAQARRDARRPRPDGEVPSRTTSGGRRSGRTPSSPRSPNFRSSSTDVV